jgi:hypothetical protein
MTAHSSEPSLLRSIQNELADLEKARSLLKMVHDHLQAEDRRKPLSAMLVRAIKDYFSEGEEG